MAYSPADKYPTAVDADPDYQGGKFRDNNPSTTNNGTPLKAIDRNELLARDEAIMNDAGFEYNGLPDTPQDSQLFKAYKASLGNGANLLSNHNFVVQTPDTSQLRPDATPRSYPPGYQIFSGVFANETTGITNLTYIDGRVSFSGGDLYFPVSNTGALARLNSDQLTASVADFDGKPRTRGVSFALVGDEYRVTVDVDALEDVDANQTLLGSVKFEQGSVATGHGVGANAQEVAHAGDSQIVGGDIWPINSNQSASIGDSLTGYSYVRLVGGVFDNLTKFSIKKDSGIYEGEGNLVSFNLSTKPYTAVIGSDTVTLFPAIDGVYINTHRGMSSHGVELENRYFGTDTNDWSSRLYNACQFAVENDSPVVNLGGGDKVFRSGVVIDGFVTGDKGLSLKGLGKYNSRMVFNPDASNTNGVLFDVRGTDDTVDTFQYAVYFNDMQFRGPEFGDDIVLGTHGLRVRQLQHPWGLKNVAFAGFDYGWEVGVSSDGGTFDDILATECNTILNLYGKDSDACVLSNSFFGGYYREAVRMSCNRSQIHSTFIGNPRDPSTIDINIVRQLTRSEDLLLSNMTSNGHNAAGSRVSYWSESANNITSPNVVIGDGALVGDVFNDIHIKESRFAKSGGDSRVAIQVNQSTQGCKIYKNDFTGYDGPKIDITDGAHGLEIDQDGVSDLLTPTSNARVVSELKVPNRVGQEVIPGLSIIRSFKNPAGLIYKESQDFAYNSARTALTLEATTTGSETGVRYDINTNPDTYRFVLTAMKTAVGGAGEIFLRVSDAADASQVRTFSRILLSDDLKSYVIEVPCFSGNSRVEVFATSDGGWVMEPIVFTGTRQSSLKTITDGGVSSESAASTIPALRGQTIISPSSVVHVAKRVEFVVTGYTGTGAGTDTITVPTSGLEVGMQVTLPIITGSLQTMDRVARTIQSIGAGTIDVSPGVSAGVIVDTAFAEFYKYL